MERARLRVTVARNADFPFSSVVGNRRVRYGGLQDISVESSAKESAQTLPLPGSMTFSTKKSITMMSVSDH